MWRCFSACRFPHLRKSRTPCGQPLRAGVGYAVRDRTVGRLLAVYGAFVFFCVPGGFLAGLHVSRVFGDSYEYLTATELAGFAGMAAGGLLMGLWGGFARKEHTLLAGLAAFGTLSILLGSSVRFDIYLGVMAPLRRGADHGGRPQCPLCCRRARRPAMQGRVFGLMGAAYSGCMPLGMAVFGPLADRLPLRCMMAVSGAALLLMAGLGAIFESRRLR